jgi:hypothetical protein
LATVGSDVYYIPAALSGQVNLERAMKKICIAAAALCAMSTVPVKAGVVFVGSQGALNALGTITQNTNFDSNGAGFTAPGSPYVVGALTFVEGGENLIGGISPPYNFTRSLITDNFVEGTTVNITGAYNLFGANAGNFRGTAGAENFLVTTTSSSYLFTPTINSAVNGGTLTFVGFQSDPGENITSVYWSGPSATGLTDIQIGNTGTGAVPEPATWLTMILGFGLMGAAMRRRPKATVRFAL